MCSPALLLTIHAPLFGVLDDHVRGERHDRIRPLVFGVYGCRYCFDQRWAGVLAHRADGIFTDRAANHLGEDPERITAVGADVLRADRHGLQLEPHRPSPSWPVTTRSAALP